MSVKHLTRMKAHGELVKKKAYTLLEFSLANFHLPV